MGVHRDTWGYIGIYGGIWGISGYARVHRDLRGCIGLKVDFHAQGLGYPVSCCPPGIRTGCKVFSVIRIMQNAMSYSLNS